MMSYIDSACALLLVAVVAVASFGPMGSSVATAQIGGITVWGFNLGGTTYTTAVARSIDLSHAQLTPVGEARQNSGFRTEGTTAYQVDDIDPLQILVMKLISGEHDDAGSRDNGFSLLCPYFRQGDPLAPSRCDGDPI